MEQNDTLGSRKGELDEKYKDGTLTPQETKELLDLYVDGSKKSNDGGTERDDSQPLEELINEQRISDAENAQKVEELEKQLNLESPHAAYRNSMVDYAKEKDKNHAERIEKWAVRVEELRVKGLTSPDGIKEDADGVSFGGLKTASKEVQDKALQDAFGDKLKSSYGRPDHQGNKERGTKQVLKKDLDTHGDQFGTFALGSMEQLTIMRARIRENFDDVKTQEDELYILQMINPDLFECMWMKDVHLDYRSYLGLLAGYVYSSDFYQSSPDGEAGLFLVQNV